MNCLTLAALFSALVAAAGLPLAASGKEMAVNGERSLDLSVPSQSLRGPWGSLASGVAAQLPALGTSPAGPMPSGGSRDALPYGAGYEARNAQRGGNAGRGWERGP